MSRLHSFGTRFGSWVERAGRRIPDPVIIFMVFFPLAWLATVFMGGHQFETAGAGGEMVSYEIKPMYQAEHVRWLFDNALLDNWLAFGGGVLGVILVVMLAIGLAENSGLFGALIKRAGNWIPQRLLPLLLMFLGIMSSMATDAGYLVLIPLAGLLYAGLGRNPLIGMAVAFRRGVGWVQRQPVPRAGRCHHRHECPSVRRITGYSVYHRRRHRAAPGDHELLLHRRLDASCSP